MTADSMDRLGAVPPATSVGDEKTHGTTLSENAVPITIGAGSQEEKAELILDDEEEVDIFSPLPDLHTHEPEEMPLTFRAIVVGLILGSLVNASNVYLGKLPFPTLLTGLESSLRPYSTSVRS